MGFWLLGSVCRQNQSTCIRWTVDTGEHAHAIPLRFCWVCAIHCTIERCTTLQCTMIIQWPIMFTSVWVLNTRFSNPPAVGAVEHPVASLSIHLKLVTYRWTDQPTTRGKPNSGGRPWTSSSICRYLRQIAKGIQCYASRNCKLEPETKRALWGVMRQRFLPWRRASPHIYVPHLSTACRRFKRAWKM